MYGHDGLLPLSSLVFKPTATRVPDLFLYRKLLRLLARRVQLVVFVTAFMMVSTAWSLSCFLFFANYIAGNVQRGVFWLSFKLYSESTCYITHKSTAH